MIFAPSLINVSLYDIILISKGGLPMGNLLVRHIPNDAIRLAKSLAAKHQHSLQEELSDMLVETIRFRSGAWSREADKIRQRLLGGKKSYSDTASLLRQDRKR